MCILYAGQRRHNFRSANADLRKQAPLLIFSFVVVALKVNIQLPTDVQQQSLSEKLRRIDGFGSLSLVGTVGCLLLGFSLKTAEELPWSNPLIYGLFIASLVSGVCFVLVEKYWAPYPVMPLRLMTQRTPLAVSISNLLISISAFSTVSLSLQHCRRTLINALQLYNVPLVSKTTTSMGMY